MADKPAWQENKSLSERHRYMLENEIATDVCFEFGTPDSSVTLVCAHTFMLIASSPVFEAMFCGGMAEARADRDNIKIPDIDTETFKEMLSYIYCEKANITASTAGPLMFAARKYLLTGLISECLEVLEKSISPDTVCTILQQITLFGEDNLKEKCLMFISVNAEDVFNTDAFMSISHDILKTVVSSKTLATTEKHVFESCVRWAKHQLLELGNEDPSDEEVREKLGDALYEIRFPTMTAEEFAGLTAHSKILTGDEKHDVYVYIVTEERLGSLKFVSSSRCDSVIKRLGTANTGGWNYSGKCDAISFETTVALWLTGVGLYGGMQASTHHVIVRVLKGEELLSETTTTMTSDGTKSPIRIRLGKPVLISANSKHVVSASIRGSETWLGVKDVSDFEQCGKIVFGNTEHSTNGTDVGRGQIPELYVMLQ